MATSRRISRFSVSRGARDRLRSSSVHSRRLTCNLRNQSSGSAGSCATPYSCRSIRFEPPAISTFLSEQTRQQYFSLRINQHQPSATSQTNRLSISNITHADSRGVGPRYNTCRAGSSLPAMGGDGRAHWLPKLDGPFWFWPPGCSARPKTEGEAKHRRVQDARMG
jgi:hypothetical protein